MDKLAERFTEQYGSMKNVGIREIIPYLALKKMYLPRPNLPFIQQEIFEDHTPNRNSLRLFSHGDGLMDILSLNLPVSNFVNFLRITRGYYGRPLCDVSAGTDYGLDVKEFTRALRENFEEEQVIFNGGKRSLNVEWYLPDENGRYLCGEVIRVNGEDIEFGLFLFAVDEKGILDTRRIRRRLDQMRGIY